MKKIVALFALALSTMGLTIGASAAEAEKKPFMEGFMKDYGHYILLAVLGLFVIVALVTLIATFKRGRAKHLKMKELKQAMYDARNGKAGTSTSETVRETTVERIIEKEGKDGVEKVVVEREVPASVQPSNYNYYDYRYYNNHAYSDACPYCGPVCRELEYEARRVPERHLNEIPPVRRPVKPIKPVAPHPARATTPILPTRTVEVKDVEADGVVTVQDDCKKVNKKHILTAVALTAVGCHLLYKIHK